LQILQKKKHIPNSQMNHSESHPERLSINNSCALQHLDLSKYCQ